MKKYFFDTNSKAMKKYGGIKEGGMSRYIAMTNYIKNEQDYTVIELPYIRIFAALQAFFFTVFKNNSVLFLQYPATFMIMGSNSFITRAISTLSLAGFKRASRNNQFILDISDLKYEQTIDLEIDGFDLDYLNKREEQIFHLNNAKYIFASYSMKEYAIKKYGLQDNMTSVCINGGLEEKSNAAGIKQINKEKINCVYTGTLNKGRMIEDMIIQLSNLTSVDLYLMGISGEWIPQFLLDINARNIYYWGSMDELSAQEIVKQCDLGLIPYDEKRLYYNIAYPTKLSFYITSGISFLSTPVNEVKRIHSLYDIGMLFKINEWRNVLSRISKSDVLEVNSKIRAVKKDFEWDNIFKNCPFLSGDDDL